MSENLADRIEALDAKATAEELRDGGRYFVDSCNDLTRCGHGDTGEYANRHDGLLVELLWNNRVEIIAALRKAETPLPDVAGLVVEAQQLAEALDYLDARRTVFGLAATLTTQAQRITELEKRLEYEPEWGHDADGIACRDDTIKLQDERLERLSQRIMELEAENARLREALRALQLQALQSNVNDPANEWGREALDLARAALLKERADG